MAAIETFPIRRDIAQGHPSHRAQPANVEAEQALLGAILINNDAFDRVSDFLRPEHFIEDIHRRIFEHAALLIRAGKLASPITLKTFLGEQDLGGATVSQYLAGSPPKRQRSLTPKISASPSTTLRCGGS